MTDTEGTEGTEIPALTDTFAALGDPMRWRILERLSATPASASALARELPISRQAIAKHIEVLRGSGLVSAAPRGREIVYVPLGSRLSAVGDDLVRLGRAWDRRLAAIREAAEAETEAQSDRHAGERRTGPERAAVRAGAGRSLPRRPPAQGAHTQL